MRFRLILSFLTVFALAAAVQAKQCELTVSTAKSVLPAGKKQTACVKVGLKGFELKSEKERAPLNVALVIDRSGSMSGAKMAKARDAAVQAVHALDSRDIVSVVAFDDQVDIVVPATKVSDKNDIEKKIRGIQERGSTALYDGTRAGIKEVKKFYEKGLVNRVVVLSDGLANVGPATTDDFVSLGKETGGQGISITTFGLGEGYNEDLMSKLASASDGNHKFIEKADELADIFNKEFKTAQSVVAQDVSVTITMPAGIRPIRALNGDADIKGQEAKFAWNQIYSSHERFFILEVEVPAGENGEKRELAQAVVKYQNAETNSADQLSGKVEVRFSNSESAVNESVNKKVLEEYIELVANLANKKAFEQRDSGDVKGAQESLRSNAKFLRDNAAVLGGSRRLEEAAAANSSQADNADSSRWNNERKKGVMLQYKTGTQAHY